MSGWRFDRIRRDWTSFEPRSWLDGTRRGYLAGAVAVVAATLAMLTVRDALGVLNVLLVFLLICFGVALTAGSGPAVLAAVLGFIGFDFFFIPPFHRLSVASANDVLALLVYVVIALVTGQLVARVRVRTEQATQEQRRSTLLHALNAALVADVSLAEVLATIAESVVHIYGADVCRILLPGPDDSLVVHARYPLTTPIEVDRQSAAVAEWAMSHRTPAGLGAQRGRVRAPHGPAAQPGQRKLRATNALFVPIATTQRTIGVIEVHERPGHGRFRLDDETRLVDFANQAALALERRRLAEEAARASVLALSDELKSVLLASVSHDLRTPLAVIKTSVTALLDPAIAWSGDDRAEFLTAIDEETNRLTSLVTNLLDLSRIESGALEPRMEWYDIGEVIEDAAEQLRPRAAASGHAIVVQVVPDLPIVAFDYAEIAQVLVNLGENALKYTPGGTQVTLSARQANGAIEVAVEDDGPGIPPRELGRVFEKFHRVNPTAGVSGGGVGLAICKGFVEANGGTIWVENLAGGGAAFRFTLPLSSEPDERVRA